MLKFKPACSFIKDLYTNAKSDITSVIDKEYEVWGNVKNVREQSSLMFITIYDGTHITPFQLILDLEKNPELTQFKGKVHAGAYVKVKGIVVKSPAKGQLIEMQVTNFNLAGPVVDALTYLPLVKGVNLDTLRGKNCYLRPKFQTYQAVYTIVDKVDKFINDFMRMLEFKKIDPNVITNSDCEGAGEVFVVTTMLSDEIADIPFIEKPVDINNPTEVKKYGLNQKKKVVDFSKDFFGKKAGLTVSSQLQLEALCPMGKGVYTLNPSFRAEKSMTRRHMGVFTHFELESKLITNVDELMNLEEDLVKYIINQTLKECREELESLNSFVSKGIIGRLESLVKDDFGRVSYTEAIEIAKKHKEEIKKLYGLDEEVEWGMDLGNSIERYISEQIYKRPVFIHSYPKALKSFYMKQNENEEKGKETVQAVDLICNGVGEIIGSSVREENYEKLLNAMKERKMNVEPLQWYLDLRKNGGMRTGGLGLGLQRLIQILCYMDSNIRDVTPFPTCYRELDF